MKVCVYAICKDEEQFVDRWVDSMQGADEIYVLDTGSTDQTVEKLKARGVRVEKKVIIPWRFDVARNESLKLVPDDCDVCVCTDLDEVLIPGWREVIEKNGHHKLNGDDIVTHGALMKMEVKAASLIMKKYMQDMIINGFILFMKY